MFGVVSRKVTVWCAHKSTWQAGFSGLACTCQQTASTINIIQTKHVEVVKLISRYRRRLSCSCPLCKRAGSRPDLPRLCFCLDLWIEFQTAINYGIEIAPLFLPRLWAIHMTCSIMQSVFQWAHQKFLFFPKLKKERSSTAACLPLKCNILISSWASRTPVCLVMPHKIGSYAFPL